MKLPDFASMVGRFLSDPHSTAINAELSEGSGFDSESGSLIGRLELRIRYDPAPCTPVYCSEYDFGLFNGEV